MTPFLRGRATSIALRYATNHVTRFLPDCHHLLFIYFNSNNGRLLEQHLRAVGQTGEHRTQVNTQVFRKNCQLGLLIFFLLVRGPLSPLITADSFKAQIGAAQGGFNCEISVSVCRYAFFEHLFRPSFGCFRTFFVNFCNVFGRISQNSDNFRLDFRYAASHGEDLLLILYVRTLINPYFSVVNKGA